MLVRVLFFGQLKDIVGRAEDRLELAEGAVLGAVLDHYRQLFPRLDALAPSIVLAHNHQFANPATPLQAGDEVALLPPVSGGAESLAAGAAPTGYVRQIALPQGHFFALTRARIDAEQLRALALCPHDGALVTFEGVVRNNSGGRRTRYLEYECYEPMAIRVLAEVGCDIAAHHAIDRIVMVHRLGRMQIGETSVAVVVSAPHRKPAFDAALEGINRLKKTVPIWKKEFFEDGEVWVDGEWDEAVIARNRA